MCHKIRPATSCYQDLLHTLALGQNPHGWEWHLWRNQYPPSSHLNPVHTNLLYCSVLCTHTLVYSAVTETCSTVLYMYECIVLYTVMYCSCEIFPILLVDESIFSIHRIHFPTRRERQMSSVFFSQHFPMFVIFDANKLQRHLRNSHVRPVLLSPALIV